MKTRMAAALILAATVLSLSYTMIAIQKAYANPVEVSWYVTNTSLTPVDGAKLTVYWSASTNGPFTQMPADGVKIYVEDKIANIKRNPVITGYWNPTYQHGMAVADVHPEDGLNGLYFYVKIEYGSVTEYWPTANSYKPGDSTWAPVQANGSPTGFAAAGPGIGTGPTTAYPTHRPPQSVIPEVPLGPAVATASMMGGFGIYFFTRRRRTLKGLEITG